MSVNNKSRIIELEKILRQNTDDKHYLVTNELLELMQEKGFEINLKTMRDDISKLREFGLPIEIIKSSPNKYYMKEHLFDVREVSMICDALQNIPHSENERVKTILEKLKLLISKHQVKELEQYMSGRNTES